VKPSPHVNAHAAAPVPDGQRFVLAHSITRVADPERGRVVVCASHGGLYSAAYALSLGVPSVIFNDAGGGLDKAGIAGLDLLQTHGVPALTVSHRSARIGDANDTWARGLVSACNAEASRLGIRAGMSTPEAAMRLPQGRRAPWAMSPWRETRHETHTSTDIRVVLLDSISLVSEDEADAIVVSGSHGGLLGGNPDTAIKVRALAVFYNDAGIGIDQAGLSRLPALDARGMAGVTVAAASARIGDARSAWCSGVVSAVNEQARAGGVEVGMPVQTAAEVLGQRYVSPSKRAKSDETR